MPGTPRPRKNVRGGGKESLLKRTGRKKLKKKGGKTNNIPPLMRGINSFSKRGGEGGGKEVPEEAGTWGGERGLLFLGE